MERNEIYTKYLSESIKEEVKQFRKENKLSMKQLARKIVQKAYNLNADDKKNGERLVDSLVPQISCIESGRKFGRNKTFLTGTMLDNLSKTFGKNYAEIIYGDEEARRNFVKYIFDDLVGLLSNLTSEESELKEACEELLSIMNSIAGFAYSMSNVSLDNVFRQYAPQTQGGNSHKAQENDFHKEQESIFFKTADIVYKSLEDQLYQSFVDNFIPIDEDKISMPIDEDKISMKFLDKKICTWIVSEKDGILYILKNKVKELKKDEIFSEGYRVKYLMDSIITEASNFANSSYNNGRRFNNEIMECYYQSSEKNPDGIRLIKYRQAALQLLLLQKELCGQYNEFREIEELNAVVIDLVKKDNPDLFNSVLA